MLVSDVEHGDGDGESDVSGRDGDSDGSDGVQWRIDDDHVEWEHGDNPVAITNGSESVYRHCWSDGDDVEHGSIDDDDRFSGGGDQWGMPVSDIEHGDGDCECESAS